MQIEVTDVRALATDPTSVRRYTFRDEPVTIGSHTANAIQLPDMSIRGYHAMILPSEDGEDGWTFQPSSPDAPATINKLPIVTPVALDDGDVIQISHFELKFLADSPTTDMELPEAGNVDELARIRQYPLPPRSVTRKGDEDVVLTALRSEALATYARALSNAYDVPTTLDATLGLLLKELGARTVWLGLRRAPDGTLDFVEGRSQEGRLSGEPWMLEGFCYRCLSRRQYILIPRTGQPDTQSCLAVPVISPRGALGLIIADTRRRVRVFDETDLDFLTVISRLLAWHFDALVTELMTRRRQMEAQELALLRDVQTRLDPRSLPEWPQLQFAAYARPGSARAGDVCDIARLPNGLAAMIVGRVTAGMTRTAMAMSEVHSAFRLSCMHADPPHILLRALNALLSDPREPCQFDAAVVVMNPKTGAMEYASGGKIGLVIVDARGNSRLLESEASPPIGASRTHAYTPGKDRVRSGGTLAFFTRGCLEAMDPSGARLTSQRLIDSLCDVFGLPASTALTDLLTDLGSFLKEGTLSEDVTVLLAHREAE